MLQRLQSVFLLGVAACMAMMVFFPIWFEASADGSNSTEVNALYIEETTGDIANQASSFPSMVIGVLAILAAVVALFEIFKYSNRLTQMKLGAMNALLMAGSLGLSAYVTFQLDKVVNPAAQGEYKLGFFLPCIALILNILANRFIRRDEKLVRSVDRLR